MSALAGRYDLRLVALSVTIAILAAGAALDLAGRVTAARGRGTREARARPPGCTPSW
ncbi:MAG TPA: MHYT domain-containing protein [Gemmatimonadales bacterium]|nr:MHYT domain-containing protein [Gemmatimonadales bacterium]